MRWKRKINLRITILIKKITMKMFSTVLIPGAKKGMEYVVTAQVNSVNPEMDSRKGPYYFIQEVKNKTGKRVKKADFKQGRFYNHEDVILAS